MTNNGKNISTKIVAARFEENVGGTEVSCGKIWEHFGYFSNQKSYYNMEKVDYPENTIYYLNQSYLTVKKNKKIYYGNFYILGQIIEVSNPTENIDTYVCKDREVNITVIINVNDQN